MLSRVFGGIAASATGNGITLITQVISIPLFLGHWGSLLFGEWLLVSTIPAYFAVGDFGFGTVAGNEMTMRVARRDKTGAVSVLQSAWLFVTLASAALTAIGAAVMWLAPVDRWLRIEALGHSTTALVVTLLLVYVFIGLQIGLIGASYRSIGEYARGTFLANSGRLIEFAAVASVVVFGHGPTVVAVAYVAVRLLTLVGLYLDVTHRAPSLGFGIQQARASVIRQLIGPALAFLCFPAGNALIAQGVSTVVGVALGPISLVTYTTTRTLVGALRQMATSINAAVWPEVSVAYARHDLPALRELHRYACQASLLLTVAGASVLFAFGEAIIRIWTGGRVSVELGFFHLMLVPPIVGTLWFTSSVVPAAINRHATMALAYLAASSGSIAAAMLVVPILGLSGAAWALVVLDAGMAAYVLRLSLDLLDDNGRAFLRSQISPPPITALLRRLLYSAQDE